VKSLASIAATMLALSSQAIAAPRLELAAHSGRVTVLAEPGLEGTAEKLATSAEATLARIHADLPNLPQPPAIEVHLVRDAEDLAAVAPAGRSAPSWAIGVAYPDLGVVSVAMRRGANMSDPETTLRHELGHVALGAALGDRAPHWLHEGFAYQHSAEWSWARTETLAGMAWFNSIIPLAELDRSFPAEELPAHRAYAESYDFVGYLSRRGRYQDTDDDGDRQPFRRFLDEIGRGSDLDTAATHAFGRPLKALFDEWRDDLNSRYKLMPIGLLGIGLWVLVSLLVVLAWWKRRRQNRRRFEHWDIEDAAAQVVAPPYIPWPGEDPLDEPDDDDRPRGPRLVN
jgi:hypothetical protein